MSRHEREDIDRGLHDDGGEELTIVIVCFCRKGGDESCGWWVEDLGETGTIGIGSESLDLLYAPKIFYIIYHLSAQKNPRPRFRPVIPDSRSGPAGGSRSQA